MAAMALRTIRGSSSDSRRPRRDRTFAFVGRMGARKHGTASLSIGGSPSRRAVDASALMRTIYSLIVAGALGTGSLVRAQGVPAAPLVISAAAVDTGGDTITIEGANFGNRPLVTLDLIPLDVRLVIASRVVGGAPGPTIPAGTYLLTVSRGPQAGDSASVTVSLGPPSPSSPTPGPSGPPSVTPPPDASDAAATLGDRIVTVGE